MRSSKRERRLRVERNRKRAAAPSQERERSAKLRRRPPTRKLDTAAIGASTEVPATSEVLAEALGVTIGRAARLR